MNTNSVRHILLPFLAIAGMLAVTSTQSLADSMSAGASAPGGVAYGTIMVDGLNIAYREAGDPKSPRLVLLRGFPVGSPQYRDLSGRNDTQLTVTLLRSTLLPTRARGARTPSWKAATVHRASCGCSTNARSHLQTLSATGSTSPRAT